MNFKDYYEEVTFDVGEGVSRPLFATKGDTESRGLYVSLYDKDSKRITDLSNLSMTLTYRRADRQGDILIAAPDGEKFRIDFPLVMFSMAGTVQMELSLMGVLGEIITSRLFSVKVRESLTHDILDNGVTKSALGVLMQFVEEEIPQIRQDELERKQAENTRISAEDARASAEGARESNEITRGSNETARESAETDRISAETSRVNAEDAREEAEGQRQDAEDVRMGNELMRISNMQVVEGWIADPMQFKGDTGDSFEYLWDDTRLGVKTDKESSYSYVDLKGEKGNTGDLHADDEIPAEPTPRDADTLGGQPRSYYDGRIDNIISTPTDISEQEIIDARHNSVTDTTHNSLGARLNEDSNKIETLGEDFAEHKLDYVEHLNSNMPHKMKVDGRDYKYGFSQENGFVKFVYEEVI